VETFATLALKRDVGIAKDTVDEVVHGRLFKFTALARLAAKRGWTTDFFSQEITNV
jgi:hypothetical protein